MASSPMLDPGSSSASSASSGSPRAPSRPVDDASPPSTAPPSPPSVLRPTASGSRRSSFTGATLAGPSGLSSGTIIRSTPTRSRSIIGAQRTSNVGLGLEGESAWPPVDPSVEAPDSASVGGSAAMEAEASWSALSDWDVTPRKSPALGGAGPWPRPASPRIPDANGLQAPTALTSSRRGSHSLSTTTVTSSHTSQLSTGSTASFHSSISVGPPVGSVSSPISRTGSHGRNQSLTSACLPATASYTPARGSDEDGMMPSSPAMTPSGGPPWRVFGWMPPADEQELSDGSTNEQSRPSGRPKGVSVHARSPLASVLLVVMGPFAHLLLGPSPEGIKKTQQQHRPSLLVRLFSAFYVTFSIIYLGTRIAGHLLGPVTPDAHGVKGNARRLIARGQDQLAMGINWGAARAGLNPSLAIDRADRFSGLGIDEAATMEPVNPEPIDELWGTSAALSRPQTIKGGKSAKTALALASANPLTPMSHPYRFSKMHSKLDTSMHDEIEPYAFRAANADNKGDVSACIYTNEAWLPELSEFVKRWGGPVSAVFESPYARNTPQRTAAINAIAQLRSRDANVRNLVDIHFVSTPVSQAALANRTRSRMISDPLASNFQANLARFFARTEMIWLVNDARILPSVGLRKKLSTPAVRELLVGRNDAVVVPVFAALRRTTEGRIVKGAPVVPLSVSAGEFAAKATAHRTALRASLPIKVDKWPTRKATLVGLSSAHPPPSVVGPGETSPAAPVFALFDRSWDPNRGPTNWPLWRKGASDPRLADATEFGGGAGLGTDSGVGGGNAPFRVTDYDLHYQPLVVIARSTQPWCTERFSDPNPAACIYQYYLAGSKMWVLPDEWAFTLEAFDAGSAVAQQPEADKLKASIQARLFSKFTQEACMHYGRAFLSLDLWEDERAAHLRATCARVLQSWGVGLTS